MRLKLTYFSGPGGRAEPARLALHIAGIAFEDVRVTPEEWAGAVALLPALPDADKKRRRRSIFAPRHH